MPESIILRQAQADAQLFDQMSTHQQVNLVRDVQYLLHVRAMYRLDRSSSTENSNTMSLDEEVPQVS